MTNTTNSLMPAANVVIETTINGSNYRLTDRAAFLYERFTRDAGALYLTIETDDTRKNSPLTAEIRISEERDGWVAEVSWYGIGGRDTEGARRQATLILLASNLADAIVADLNPA